MHALCADGVLRQPHIHVQPCSFEMPHLLLLLQSCLAESGIELPSPIQEAAMPQLLAGHNAAVQSYTGSGKVSSACAGISTTGSPVYRQLYVDVHAHLQVYNMLHRYSKHGAMCKHANMQCTACTSSFNTDAESACGTSLHLLCSAARF
jgi:hypothetical protein